MPVCVDCMLNLPMDLPFLKKPKESAPARQYLFAIEISPGIIKGAVWTVANAKTQVVAVGHAVAWDDKTSESLVAAVDETITDAANHLDPSGKLSPDQAILGLSATWVQDEKIMGNKLAILKDMATKLELKLVGFVVTPEAVVKYLQFSENVPPSAILLGFWPQHIELTLVRLGKVLGIQLVNRSSNPADDVVEGLSRFTNIDMLPSRMLMYDSGTDLEEIKQLLLSYPWQAPQRKLPFLHFPKVETLASDYTVRAIALAGGTEVAKAIGLLSEDAPIPTPTPAPAPIPVGSSLEELGFVREGEIVETATPEETAVDEMPAYQTVPPKKGMPKMKVPKISLPSVGSYKLVAAAFLLLLVACGLGFVYWYLPKASVELFLSAKPLSKSFTLTANTKATSVDPSGPSIPAAISAVTVSGNKSAATTGTKLVGDAAKGSVTILNTTDSTRTLPAGTILTSPSGIKFALDAVVTVASGSGSVFNPQPGKATAAVTASQIGTDSNISGGTEFRVGTFAATQLAARNDAAMSGGTSRQAKAVSKDDINALRTALVAELKNKAHDQLTGQIDSDKTIITESITTDTVSEEFSNKVDEVADNLSLKLTVKASGLVIAKADLAQIVEAQLKPAIPENFTEVGEPKQSFSVKKADKDIVQLQAQVSTSLLPHMDTDQIAANITGKGQTQVREYLQSLPSLAHFDLTITPNLPIIINTLPHITKNISVSVKAESE